MWIRQQCLNLSRNWSTPVTCWLDMPLKELHRWIEASNDLIKEMNRG